MRIVEPEQYLQSIGFLAGNKAFAESPEAYDGAGFDEPMMVMAGFSERKLDLFLTEMRRKSAADRPQSHRHNAEPGVEFAAALQRIKRRTRKNEIVPGNNWSGQKSGIGTFLHATTPYNRVQSKEQKVPDTKGVSCYEK